MGDSTDETAQAKDSAAIRRLIDRPGNLIRKEENVKRRSAGALLLTALLSGGALLGQEEAQRQQADGTYELKGTVAPIGSVLDSFLGQASAAHGGNDHDPEFYRGRTETSNSPLR